MSENGSREKRQKRAGVKSATPDAKSKDRFASGYDFLLLNQDLMDSTFPEVMGTVNLHQANKKVVLILVTYGGQANVAYRIARFLQTVYEEVVAFIPAECKSAGTLMVTAARTVVISPFGEFGPLDVQLLRRDELAGRRSGLTTRSALEDLKTHSFELFEHFMTEIITKSGTAVSFRLAAEIASRMSSRVMSRIYEQINPDALGQDYRDLNIALKYGERLNREYGNLKKGALHRLVYDYPSHDFVIDLEEAQEIFERVELPAPTLVRIMTARSLECLVPKTGRQKLCEMVTNSGQKMLVQKTGNDEKAAKAKTDEHAAVPIQRNGDGQTTPA
ncbi:MAG TPA: hypothetical protein VHV56_03835 [Pseudolabrys sp.]|jgi:hypothetical protein|nr:hypothetical protein [Pseudolabrys sp.]